MNAIKEVGSYNEMVDRTIKQSDQIKSRIINNYNKVKVQRNEIIANKDLYTTESFNDYINDFERYKKETQKSIESYDGFKRNLENNKKVNLRNITTIQDWTAKKGELSRDIQLQRMKLPPRPVASPGYTIKWIEGGKEKTATFDTSDQLSNFMGRLEKRDEVSQIRRTGTPSRVPAKGILSGLQNATWKYQTLIDLERSRPDKDKEDPKKHPWSRAGKYDLPTAKEIQTRLGWAATQTATGAVRAVPYVLGSVAGALVFGPAGGLFIPAVMAGFSLPSVTTVEGKKKFIEYVEEHPEIYTELMFQTLGALAVGSLSSSALKKATTGTVKKVKMTNVEYLKYLEEHPWSGGMASSQQESMSWIDQLILDMIDRVAPSYQKPGLIGKKGMPRAGRSSTAALRAARRATSISTPSGGTGFVTVPMPPVYSPLWASALLTPGALDRIKQGLSDRGLTDTEIENILVGMGKSQEEFIAPLMANLEETKLPSIEDLKKLTIHDIEQTPILIPDIEEVTELTIEPIIEPITEPIVEPIIEPILEPPIIETILEPDIVNIVEPQIQELRLKLIREGRPRKMIERETSKLRRRLKQKQLKGREAKKTPRHSTPQRFEIRFQYYASSENIKVRARSWHEAIVNASNRRKIRGEVLEVEVEKL